jgi:hypothetical protein
MKTRQTYSFALMLAAAGFLCTVGAGCSNKSYDKYVPSQDKAREALEVTLNAWRDGKKPGGVDGAPVQVQAVDSHWQQGEKITGYEIQGPRVFSVQLTMQRPPGKQVTVRYFVVGKEPLWVYREDDYKAPAGM